MESVEMSDGNHGSQEPRTGVFTNAIGVTDQEIVGDSESVDQFASPNENGSSSFSKPTSDDENILEANQDVDQQAAISAERSGNMPSDLIGSNLDLLADCIAVNGNGFIVDDGDDGSTVPVAWSNITGLKMKEYTKAELDAFKKPFDIGWTRELVLRGTVSSTGKRLGDVYYFSPDKKTKLRSYVEMGMFLRKNADCGLEPENFTFARQPVYKGPEEVVRNALQRGGIPLDNQPNPIVASALAVQDTKPTLVENLPRATKTDKTSSKSAARRAPVAIAASPALDTGTLAEGRSKRKSKAPARFEDEDYSEHSPFKKKSRGEKTPVGPSPLIQATPKDSEKKVHSSKSSLLASSGKKSRGQTLLKSQPTPLSAPSATSASTTTNVTIVEQSALLSPAVSDKSENLVISESPKASESGSVSEEISRKTPVVQSINNQVKKEDSSLVSLSKATAEAASVEEKAMDTESSEINNQATTPLSNGSVPNGLAELLERPIESRSSPVIFAKKKSIMGKTKSARAKSFKPIRPKPLLGSGAVMDDIATEPMDMSTNHHHRNIEQASSQPVPPCSITCYDRHGSLPGSLCSRCLCLFHPECVPDGIYLNDPHQFICSNCVQSSDLGTRVGSTFAVNGHDGLNEENNYGNGDVPQRSNSKKHSLMTSNGGSRFQISHGSGKSFQPILPKPLLKQQPSPKNAHNVHYTKKLAQMPPSLYHGQQHHQAMQPAAQSSRPKLQPQQQIVQRSGHLQVNHPMFNQQKSSKKRGLIPGSGLLSRNQHQHMSKVIQTQLQAFYQPPPIAPIAPIKVTPAQIASMLDKRTKRKRGYREYMIKMKPTMSALTSGYDFLNYTLQYLSVKDLMNLKQVNRTFRNLASQPYLWKKLKLKGICIRDWQYLGHDIIENVGSTELDFDGVRLPQGTGLCDMWRNFGTIVDFLKSVKVLRFGSIPTFIIEDIVSAAVTENCYNSFSKLESLVVKHIFEEDSEQKDCNISFMENLPYLKELSTLKISCKNGLTVASGQQSELENILLGLPKLRSLSLPNLKGFSHEQFSFLSKLPKLIELQIGSCVSWTNVEDEPQQSDSEGQQFDPHALRGVYKHLGQLTNLETLKLVETIIDDTSMHLPLALQRMPKLTVLAFESLTVSPDAIDTLEILADTLRLKLPYLKRIAINSDDSQTNRCVYDLLKKLRNLDELVWKVGAIVEDSGECLVPLAKERSMDESDLDGEMDLTSGEENSEIIDVTVLTDLLQKYLVATKISIFPQ